MYPLTEKLIEQAVSAILYKRYGRGNKMSISMPTNKTEKKTRYRMLVKQGSLTIKQARKEYRRYLHWSK